MKNSKFFGSIYTRFLGAFLGAFLLSMIVPFLLMNLVKGTNIIGNVQKSLMNRAENLQKLLQESDLPLQEAVNLLATNDIKIEVLKSLEEVGIQLTPAEEDSVMSGGILSKAPTWKNSSLYAVFKNNEHWVYLYPDNHNSPISIFASLQLFLILIPVTMGTILIVLTTITVVRPIKKISNASKIVTNGDFSVRVVSAGSGELKELTENFNNMIQVLSSNEYLHKEFVSNISHEFNTPITSLKGYAKLLKRSNLTTEKRQEYADIIIFESDRLSKLSSDLLRLSELENVGFVEEIQQFSLDEQIRDAMLLLENEWVKKQLDIDLDMDEAEYTGDKPLMYQVWVNIISNAIKYSTMNGKLLITLKKDESEHIIIRIKDNGVGISKEDLDNIFLRFYQADKTRNSNGTGLGLSIAKKIVELHGGKISVESEVGMGSCFIIKL